MKYLKTFEALKNRNEIIVNDQVEHENVLKKLYGNGFKCKFSGKVSDDYYWTFGYGGYPGTIVVDFVNDVILGGNRKEARNGIEYKQFMESTLDEIKEYIKMGLL